MSEKSYTVIVPGILKKNGTMAHYGEEVTEVNCFVDQFEKEEKVQLTSEFKKEEKAKLAELEEAERLKAEADAKDLKDHNDLLASYKTKFKAEAPEGTSKELLTKAIADNKAVGAQ